MAQTITTNIIHLKELMIPLKRNLMNSLKIQTISTIFMITASKFNEVFVVNQSRLTTEKTDDQDREVLETSIPYSYLTRLMPVKN